MQDYIPLWVALIGAVAAIVVALAAVVPSVLSYKSLKASRDNAAKMEENRLAQEASAAELKAAQEANAAETAMLAKNIDGAMAEIKLTIAAKNLAEGKLEGIESEQARVLEAPQLVTSAANEQLDKIEATGIRVEQQAMGVAQDLAESQKRAHEVDSTEAGAAADAAAKNPEKGK